MPDDIFMTLMIGVISTEILIIMFLRSAVDKKFTALHAINRSVDPDGDMPLAKRDRRAKKRTTPIYLSGHGWVFR